MSYILDALKKSEQKRRQGTSPDLLTAHDAAPHGMPRRTLWPYLFLAAALLNAGLLFWWLHPWHEVKTVSPRIPGTAERQPEAKQQERAAAAEPAKPAADAADRSREKHSASAHPPKEKTGSANAGVQQKLYRLSELPSSVQQALPSISISGHFYDEDPASRIVSINGRILHEGQTAAEGLRLERITRDGVVMSCRGYRFSIEIF